MTSQLVADCPRCRAIHTTFDVRSGARVGESHGWQNHYEVFAVCRHCGRATIYCLSEAGIEESKLIRRQGVAADGMSLNGLVRITGYIGLKDQAGVAAPEHLPVRIEVAFKEGATCLAVDCPNAAGAMFRLCLDMATKEQLPAEDVDGLNVSIRRSLGLRLRWLFEKGHLPPALEDLFTCIKDDGNDGAHDGTLTRDDAEDLLDFTVELLRRLYTEPKSLELAKERRIARRSDLQP